MAVPFEPVVDPGTADLIDQLYTPRYHFSADQDMDWEMPEGDSPRYDAVVRLETRPPQQPLAPTVKFGGNDRWLEILLRACAPRGDTLKHYDALCKCKKLPVGVAHTDPKDTLALGADDSCTATTLTLNSAAWLLLCSSELSRSWCHVVQVLSSRGQSTDCQLHAALPQWWRQ